MNIFKQLYLRLFKGYTKMDHSNMLIIKFWFMYSERMPEIISVNTNCYLISKPKPKGLSR